MTATSPRRDDYRPILKLRRCKFCQRTMYDGVSGWYLDNVCTDCESKHLHAALEDLKEDRSELEKLECCGHRLDRYEARKLEELAIREKQLVQRIDQLEGVTYGN